MYTGGVSRRFQGFRSRDRSGLFGDISSDTSSTGGRGCWVREGLKGVRPKYSSNGTEGVSVREDGILGVKIPDVVLFVSMTKTWQLKRWK